MDDGGAVRPRPRDRIVGTARDLFRRHGIRGVGVDAIADAAGSNKMTLYRHFGSKDDLVVACLKDVACDADALWARLEADNPDDPMGRLQGWLRAGALCAGDDGRGCDMVNAAVELAEHNHPARAVIESFKTRQRDRLAQLCRDAGAREPDLLADTLTLLLEGARVNRQSVGAEGSCARFIRMGEAIVASFMKDVSPAKSETEQVA
ncbi:MAG: TetR/AcrR family transcriptional regulator [Rhizobiales bacterium]|nr:TetR/AcrR family transcriptional regulator [Hyphomicrobiales bacterium]